MARNAKTRKSKMSDHASATEVAQKIVEPILNLVQRPDKTSKTDVLKYLITLANFFLNFFWANSYQVVVNVS